MNSASFHDPSNQVSDQIMRGKRLSRLRNILNLTRLELCNSTTINFNTYKGWELGKFGGLTAKGADKIISFFNQNGVICNIKWLMDGEGIEPYFIPKSEMQPDSCLLENEQLIINEIGFLNSYLKDIIYYKIADDGMLPEFDIGDYVAGIKVNAEGISDLINKNCIIHTKNGDYLVRQIRKGSVCGKYNLICINIHSNVNEPLMYDVEINYAAKIIRKYYKN